MTFSTSSRRKRAQDIERFLVLLLSGASLSKRQLLAAMDLMREDASAADPVLQGRLVPAREPQQSYATMVLQAMEYSNEQRAPARNQAA